MHTGHTFLKIPTSHKGAHMTEPNSRLLSWTRLKGLQQEKW